MSHFCLCTQDLLPPSPGTRSSGTLTSILRKTQFLRYYSVRDQLGFGPADKVAESRVRDWLIGVQSPPAIMMYALSAVHSCCRRLPFPLARQSMPAAAGRPLVSSTPQKDMKGVPISDRRSEMWFADRGSNVNDSADTQVMRRSAQNDVVRRLSEWMLVFEDSPRRDPLCPCRYARGRTFLSCRRLARTLQCRPQSTAHIRPSRAQRQRRCPRRHRPRTLVSQVSSPCCAAAPTCSSTSRALAAAAIYATSRSGA